MKRKRPIGSAAVVFGFAAALVLAGLSAAHADELSDLQANVKALQKRVDQLALGAKPVPRGAPSLAGSFPRSFLIPGTNTSIRLGGAVVTNFVYGLNGGQPQGAPAFGSCVGATCQLEFLPLNLHGQSLYGISFNPPGFNPSSRSNGTLWSGTVESDISVETRTPTAWGEIGTFWDMNGYGCIGADLNCQNVNKVVQADIPRVVTAYATWGGWLIGKAVSDMVDPDAQAETIDYAGQGGIIGVIRQPQIRYTYHAPYGIVLSGSLEQGETDVFTPQGLAITSANTPGGLAVDPAKSNAPGVTGVVQWNQPWGHIRLQGVVQTLNFQDGAYISKEFVGGGGGFAGIFRPGWFGWSRDNFTFNFTAGNGLGHYLYYFEDAALATNFGGCGTYVAVPAGPSSPTGAACAAGTALYGHSGVTPTAAGAADIHVRTIPSWTGNIAYQHFWSLEPRIRTNVEFAMFHQTVPLDLIGPQQAMLNVNQEIMDAHVNLIWSPVAFVDTGIEYMWGHRKTVGGAQGNENILLGMFKVKF